MEVIGQGQIHYYDEEDEGPHAFTSNDWWNESVWLQFLEVETGLHGAIRIGHQPNWQGGHSSIWSMIGTPEWVYKRDGLYPLRTEDKIANGFGANGTHGFEFRDGKCHWSIRDEDIEVDLVTSDFHKPFGFTPGIAMENIAKNHLEAASEIEGVIRIRGKEYRVRRGLSYRDHSWGPRYWLHMRVHRFTAATFGPDLSCNAICFYDEADRLSKWGYVRREGKIIVADEVDVIAYMEADGVSNRGGMARFLLPGGEEMIVAYRPANKGMLSRQHSLVINDTICRAEHGGRVGGAVFETNSNWQGGTLHPTGRALVRSIIDNGITPAAPAFDGFFPNHA